MPRLCLSILLSLLLLITLNETVNAQVVINEVFPNPPGEEKGAEWVELYNLDNQPASLKDCILYLHATNNTQNVVFGDEDFIDKFEVISWDGIWLKNTGDQVRLICPNDTDTVSYGDAAGSIVEEPEEGFSIGRNPDGTGNIFILSSVTLGANNSPPPTPTFTPTPEPTSTPKPTSTPNPTPTVKKTATPKPTIKAATTKKVVPTQSSVAIKQGEDSDEVILGLRNQLSITPTESLGEKSNRKFPFPAILMIVGGISFMGAAGYPFIKEKIKRYNTSSEKIS